MASAALIVRASRKKVGQLWWPTSMVLLPKALRKQLRTAVAGSGRAGRCGKYGKLSGYG
jgi:hypothetical protein